MLFYRSLSRDDIIDLEPLYEGSWGHCSRAARVSVSKTCVPPGSVIILAEEVNTGEVKTHLPIVGGKLKIAFTSSFIYKNYCEISDTPRRC